MQSTLSYYSCLSAVPTLRLVAVCSHNVQLPVNDSLDALVLLGNNGYVVLDWNNFYVAFGNSKEGKVPRHYAMYTFI